METNIGFSIKGHIKIHNPQTGEVLVDRPNAINFESMSLAVANSLSNRGVGTIYQMAFGNGASSIDSTGLITYLPPNTVGQNAALYNQTYAKIVDDTLISNPDPSRNKMTVSHVAGKLYSDILVTCLLDYGEPSGQYAFDNATSSESDFTFDEIGLLANYGTDGAGNVITRLLTHVVFHPVQKSLNRTIQIDYTIRVSALTSLVTV